MKNSQIMLNEKNLELDEKIEQTSTHGLDTTFPESSQPPHSNQVKNHITLNSKLSQISIAKLNNINTFSIQPREFITQIAQSFNIPEISDSNYIHNKIKNKSYDLRISDHSANSYYSTKVYHLPKTEGLDRAPDFSGAV